ncbi:MAG: endonuclease [Corallococcus sp.]|nr:endonuclease [Corallococcus sp.]MCM1360064.1 endonuclease [Corallococcus sp.]MCM1395621.1 endonuclease [Corallococcus sp.]
MQKRSAILITSLMVAIVLCAAVLPCVFAGNGVASAATGNYYAPITATGGTELLGQLHDLITSTHTKYTSYNDCKTPSTVQKTDAGSGNGKVMEFYSQADIDGSWGQGNQGTWNREHVWCQSLSNDLWGESGGGSDLHHIRPVESGLNSARGNLKYGVAVSKNKVYYEDHNNNPVALGGYIGNSVFEPIDSVKGDVARIVLYVYTHYNTYSSSIFEGHATTNGSRASGSFGNLPIRNVISASSDKAAFSMLMSWNELDPVDDVERNRNEAVADIQGNRNPFIDHPEYVSAIWGDGSIGGGDTPTNELTLSQTSLVLCVGETANLTATTTSGTLSWKSSDTSVASVSAGGVKANKVGTAVITVSNGTTSLQCVVTVVEGSPAEFSQLVNGIQNCQTLEEKFIAIKSALTVYSMLDATEKQSVASDYQTLQSAIADYNNAAQAVNDDMTGAIASAVAAMAVFAVVLKVVMYLLNNRLM